MVDNTPSMIGMVTFNARHHGAAHEPCRECHDEETAGGRHRARVRRAPLAYRGGGMIAAAAWHDWLFIDMEHGAFSQDDVAQICIAAVPTGVTPIVRICAGALDEGTRALDNGA